jgi:hypothetical protein
MRHQTFYHYYLNLAERGSFHCDVRNSRGNTVWSVVFEDGDNQFDYEGIPIPWRGNYNSPPATPKELYLLEKYLKERNIMAPTAMLMLGQI